MPRRCLPGLLFLALLAAEDKKELQPDPPLNADETTILELTNKARVEKELPRLTINPLLTKAARAHSANMAKQEKMDHVLDGKNPSDRVKAAGYKYSWTGENIAVGENVTVQQIFDGWMNSEGHRKNILKKEYREIGVGSARNDKGEVYYTQVFGAPLEE
jgi:uncharacterized protein YkwD